MDEQVPFYKESLYKIHVENKPGMDGYFWTVERPEGVVCSGWARTVVLAGHMAFQALSSMALALMLRGLLADDKESW